MVELAPGVGAFAAGGGAGGVFEAFGHSLGLGEQPALAAEVEGDGLGAEDGGEDAGGAGEAAGFAGGERLVGVEVGCLHRTGQDGVVDGDDHGGRGLGVQVVGGEVLEELGERESAAVPPVEGPVLGAGAVWFAHASGCGHRVDDLAEHRGGQGGDGEVSGGGAVAVVVQGQRALLPGGLLLGADELVLVGVDDLLVGFDGLDRPARDPAELVGAEPGRLLHQGCFDGLALLRAHPVGQLTGGSDDHCRVLGGDEPGVQGLGGGVVARLQFARQCDLAGCIRRGTRWWSWRARRRHR